MIALRLDLHAGRVVAGDISAQERTMSRMTMPSPGVPFWTAQLSPDADAAMEFYGAVFGWAFENVADADAPPFYIASRRGARVASLTGPQDPAAWIVAVTVGSLDLARRDAAATGGTAPGESIDITTLGRFHRCHDPAGAEIHVVEPLAGSEPTEPGTWATITLDVNDDVTVASVAPFYRALFGWRLDETGPRTVFRLPGHTSDAPGREAPNDTIAIIEHGPAVGTAEISARWIPDFLVPDVETAVETATARGGCVVGERTTRSARTAVVLSDPDGARFSISQQQPGR